MLQDDQMMERLAAMEPLGEIVRLQVQRSSLKVGLKRKWYDPSPILPLPLLSLTTEGVVGLDDETRVIDVHHATHASGKNRGYNPVSVGFSAHYDVMRDRFGAHLEDGVAGETILVGSDRVIGIDDLANGLVIRTREGVTVHLDAFRIAEPCVEFTRHALQWPHDAPSDRTVADGLQFLRGGMRGFYATYSGAPARLRIGDTVYLP